MTLYKTYKSGESKFDQVDWLANSETWDEDIKQFRKQEYISIIKEEIKRLEGEKIGERPENWEGDNDPQWWDENHIGYNQAIDDQISHLQSELLLIEKEK